MKRFGGKKGIYSQNLTPKLSSQENGGMAVPLAEKGKMGEKQVISLIIESGAPVGLSSGFKKMHV